MSDPLTKKQFGKVYFLGAGSGDPELLTRKAFRLLSSADVILHDALVSPEILRLAPSGATLVPVGKRCGEKSITQDEIHTLLIRHARAGRMVVRLQGGDPLIFGRAGEEIAAIEEAGIEFEIVPGVTAASAAAAAAQVSLTRRGVAAKLILTSAHRPLAEAGTEAEARADWAGLPSSGATLAVYMPGRHYEEIARELVAAGWPTATPCVIVSQAGSATQSVLRADLAALAELAASASFEARVPAPAILLIGAVTEKQALEAAASAPGSSQSES